MRYTLKDFEKIDKANKVSELPDKISDISKLEEIQDVSIPDHLKDSVEQKELNHRDFNDTAFWQTIPYFKNK